MYICGIYAGGFCSNDRVNSHKYTLLPRKDSSRHERWSMPTNSPKPVSFLYKLILLRCCKFIVHSSTASMSEHKDLQVVHVNLPSDK